MIQKNIKTDHTILIAKLFLSSILMLAVLSFSRGTAVAQTLTVCSTGCDHTSIKAAVVAASDGDTIEVLNDIHTENNINIFKNVTIVGQGAHLTTVQAAGIPNHAEERVFQVLGGVTTHIKDMTIQYGHSTSTSKPGGGIFNHEESTTTLTNVHVRENHSNRGGIANYGTMFIYNSQITKNSGGGGIFNSGQLNINDSVISENSNRAVENTNTAVIHNSQIRNNIRGIYNNAGNLTVRESNFYGNHEEGIYFLGGDKLVVEKTHIENNGRGIAIIDASFNADFIASLHEVELHDNGLGLDLLGGVNVTLINSDVSANTRAGDGAGIAVGDEVTLRVHGTRFYFNRARAGAGLYVCGNNADVSLTNVAFAHNHATEDGAGIYMACSQNSLISVTNATISYNTANGNGAGVYLDPYGEVNMANVTIVNNTVDDDDNNDGAGGGVFVDWTYVTVGSLTIRKNGTLRVKNSLIAHNEDISPTGDDGQDCDGRLISAGYNIIGDLGSNPLNLACDVTGESTNQETDLTHIGDLADNGGPTQSHLPATNSPLLDAGTPEGCTDFAGNLILSDQRGAFRPLNGRCDIGAIEGTTYFAGNVYLPMIVGE